MEHIPELERLKQISENLVSPELSVRIVDALPDALVVINESGIVVLFNQKAELLFGYSRAEIFGKPVEMLLPEHLRVDHAASRHDYMVDPQVRPMGNGRVLTGRHKTAREFTVEINLSPIVTTDGTFVCAVIRRVIERDRTADARA